ncbi:MAG TPA: ABC transporter permease, partial [Actinomycetota bacterium]|nr:ABC transporter permease [Actinomycetota bacterium]
MMEATLRDLWLAARAIRRSPAISVAVILTLAVGLGATLAIVSVVDGVLIDPVPVPDAHRVVRVFEAWDAETPYSETAYPTLQDYRRARANLEGPTGFASLDVGIRADDLTDRVSAGLVTGDYFQVLQVPAVLGRTLQPADDRLEAPPTAVLGYALWQRMFGGDLAVLGRTVEVSGTPFEVVGVSPEGFRGVTLSAAPELWIPLSHVRQAAAEGLFAAPNVLTTRAFPWIAMVARLPDGATAAAAEAVLDGVAHALRSELGDDSGLPDAPRIVSLRPLAASATLAQRDRLIRFVELLGGVVAMTLVVACLNGATLISARAWTRSRELGVRQALGARRGRLMWHLLAEGLVMALAGGGAGLGLAFLATRAIRRFALPGGVPLSRVDLSLDGRLVAAALALSTLSALAFGLGPALSQSRRDVGERLREGGRTTSGRSRALPLMVTVQVALSLVLVVGALLFTRTLRAALGTDLGFEPGPLAAVSMGFRGQGYAVDELPDAVERILADVEASPAVRSAAFAAHVPLAPRTMGLRPVPEGAGEDYSAPVININVVSPHYFETLGVPLLEGRAFEPGDTEDAPDVAVVNEAAAELLWPGERPLGRTFVLLRGLDPVRVVGVARDHKVHAVTDEAVP